jgi:polyisoprenoid-binding protein YceI
MRANSSHLVHAALLLLVAGPATAQTPLDDGTIPGAIPAGTYQLDPTHSSLFFRVDHLGMSRYTARFTRLDATLEIDPEAPEDATLTATVDPLSLDTAYPLDDLDFDAVLTGPDWLDAASHPLITFTSTTVRPTGPTTAEVEGKLALAGITRPVRLDVTFNGGYAGHVYDPGGSRIGFSAEGVLQRSAFGLDFGIPAPGSTVGVGDRVEFFIEAELTRPRDQDDD